jgi:MFS family permease
MSMLSAIVSIVQMAGPPLTGFMLHWTSWRGVYAFITTFALVIGVLVWLRIAESLAHPDPRATDPRRMGKNILAMLRRASGRHFGSMDTRPARLDLSAA